MKESFPRILYNCPSVDSIKALEAPSKAITHIQKIAPGPPIAIAVATPARFPVPTRLAIEMANAWKDDTCFSACFPFPADSLSNTIISRIMRNCTKRVRMLNQTAHPKSMMIRIYVQRISFISLIKVIVKY